MANALTKIEKDGQAEFVDKLLADGVKSVSKIRAKLIESGYDISKSAVNNYVKKVIDKIKPQAFKIVTDHIDKVIPDDMQILESFEAQLVEWAGEDPIDTADRIADARSKITRDLDIFKDILTGPVFPTNSKIIYTEEQENEERARKLVQRALYYLVVDARLQKKRIEAIKEAVRIIGLKLQHIATLEGEGKGNIIIMDRSEEYKPPEENKYERFSIIDGLEDDDTGK